MQPFLLHHLLSEAAKTDPDREAVYCDSESLTYSQLYDRSLSMAELLRSCGTVPGDRIGLMLKKSVDTVAALYGILMSGAAYVPIDVHLPLTRVKYILQNCDIRILVTSPRESGKILAELSGATSLDTIIQPGSISGFGEAAQNDLKLVTWPDDRSEGSRFEPVDVPDTFTAYILHTSGSTGVPKGVVISHLNSLTFVRAASEYFGIIHNDRMACHAPLHFDLSVFDIFVAAANRAAVVMVPESVALFPVKLTEYMADMKVTVWNSVSSALTTIADQLEKGGSSLPDLKHVIFSGEIMPLKYLRSLMNNMGNARFYNIYGQTEANSSTGFVIEGVPESPTWKIPVGKSLPNFEVFLVNAANEEVRQPFSEGEIHVKSSSVASGYLNMPELTREKFIPDPRQPEPAPTVYRTGDQGYYDEDGNLIFAGRADNMVKVRGHRVELDEIERTISSFESVKLAVVVALPDEKQTNRLVAFLSWKDSGERDSSMLKAYCEQGLPRYMIPERFLVIENWPLTANDKIDRKTLLTEAMSVLAGGQQRQAPD